MTSRARSREPAAIVPISRWQDRLLAVRRSRIGQALATHEHRTAAGLFALLVIVYLWPALIGGRPLMPLTVLYAWSPWHYLIPADVAGYINSQLTDVPTSYYPWDTLARELIHAGTFPAWNPYAFAGTPFFANPEVAWLSPFSLPLWVLPLHYGLGVAAALKLWMAAFGTYLLVRELHLGFWPGILAGASFALCAYNIVWLSHGVHVSVAVLLPWTLWLVERTICRGRSRDGVALAAIVAFVLTGGHPGTQLHVLTAGTIYAVIRTIANPGTSNRQRYQRLALIAAALIVGALIAAVTLLPAQQAAIDTVGAVARRNRGEKFWGGDIPFGALRTALFPDWWGRPSELITHGPSNYNERTFYAGTVALVLALTALASREAWRQKAPFVLLGAIGTAAAIRGSGIHALVNHLPLLDRVQNQRMLLWLLLAIPVLAAFGLQSLIDAPRRQRHAWTVVAGAAAAALIAGATTSTAQATLGSTLRYLTHRTGNAPASVLALASIGWWTIFVGATATALLIARRQPQRRWLVGCLLALAAALDMLHFAHGYQPMGPPEKAALPHTPAISYLQAHARASRIAGVSYALASDFTTVYHLRDARGYDAPQPSQRYYRLWRKANPDQGLHTLFTIPALTPTSIRILGLLSARYIVADPGTEVRSPLVSRVYSGRDATVFKNALAASRARATTSIHLASTTTQEIAAITQPAFDPRRDAVIRRDELHAPLPSKATGTGTVRITGDRNSRVTLTATLPHPSLVILNDAWAPGWTVTIDGRPARALRTNVVMRGVITPTGTHTITWTYHVPGLRLGAILSGLGLLALLGWTVSTFRTPIRRREPRTGG